MLTLWFQVVPKLRKKDNPKSFTKEKINEPIVHTTSFSSESWKKRLNRTNKVIPVENYLNRVSKRNPEKQQPAPSPEATIKARIHERSGKNLIHSYRDGREKTASEKRSRNNTTQDRFYDINRNQVVGFETIGGIGTPQSTSNVHTKLNSEFVLKRKPGLGNLNKQEPIRQTNPGRNRCMGQESKRKDFVRSATGLDHTHSKGSYATAYTEPARNPGQKKPTYRSGTKRRLSSEKRALEQIRDLPITFNRGNDNPPLITQKILKPINNSTVSSQQNLQLAARQLQQPENNDSSANSSLILPKMQNAGRASNAARDNTPRSRDYRVSIGQIHIEGPPAMSVFSSSFKRPQPRFTLQDYQNLRNKGSRS